VDSGAPRSLRGRYLIAADGGHSKAREVLGMGYEGRGAFSNSLTIYFTAATVRMMPESPGPVRYSCDLMASSHGAARAASLIHAASCARR
jgi:2-polyprenyl-6-methoxyphenol hydroxylase-like FAD-dependent oxidoreductase